jgi:alpha-glucosidase
VLCNDDVTRTVTRYGRDDTGFDVAKKRGTPAALLSIALPGSVCLFQGEELGLPEADIAPDRIQDPMWEALCPRRTGPGFGEGPLSWLLSAQGVFASHRRPDLRGQSRLGTRRTPQPHNRPVDERRP